MEDYIQQTPTHHAEHAIGWIALAVVVICLIVIGVGKHWNNPYRQVNNTQDLTEHDIINRREMDSASDKLEVDFYYLKGCHHCNSVASVAVPGVRKVRKHDNTIVMNAAPHDMHAYLRRNRVFGYPTVAVRYHGYLIYQYTGMSKRIFKTVFDGIDPVTKRPFRHQVPTTTYRANGYTQRLSKEPALTTSRKAVSSREY